MRVIEFDFFGKRDAKTSVRLLTVERRRWWWPFTIVRETWLAENKFDCDFGPQHAHWYLKDQDERAGCFLSLNLENAWTLHNRRRNLLNRIEKAYDETIGLN